MSASAAAAAATNKGKQISGGVSRSVYVAQLRRAFLLRAHPDRFRQLDDHVRRGQATLLQALSDRWSSPDFQDYTSNISSSLSHHSRMMTTPSSSSSSSSNSSSHHFRTKNHPQSIPYVLEKRDGSLLKQTIRLDDSVENVLQSLAKALELTGASSLPPPPPPLPDQADPHGTYEGLDANSMFWASSSSSSSDATHAASRRGEEAPQFDVNSQKGRDLLAFLQATPASAMEERRMYRVDASAAALVARRLYSFQAIDGVSMGWSSESFAILVRSLIRLHEEYSSRRFHVDSFYPLRLVFSQDDGFFHSHHSSSSLDVYGGILYLHPAATQLQMLETLQEVTEEKLQEFQRNRQLLQERTAQLQNELGVKVTKGYSCSSEEYHSFLERMIVEAELASTAQPEALTIEGLTISSTELELERVRMVVESPVFCRRARLTKEGHIQTHADMTLDELRTAQRRWSPSARQRREELRHEEEQCQEAIQQIQWTLGLQTVRRKGLVSHSEFMGSLARLMSEHATFRSRMAGHSVGIAGSGQFCHLADDGSIIIPHNWR